MMISMNILKYLWGRAVMIAAQLINSACSASESLVLTYPGLRAI
jgi:hypothetical protein